VKTTGASPSGSEITVGGKVGEVANGIRELIVAKRPQKQKKGELLSRSSYSQGTTLVKRHMRPDVDRDMRKK